MSAGGGAASIPELQDSVGVMPDGNILVGVGNRLYGYDLVARRWIGDFPIPGGLEEPAMVVAPDGRFIVSGGMVFVVTVQNSPASLTVDTARLLGSYEPSPKASAGGWVLAFTVASAPVDTKVRVGRRAKASGAAAGQERPSCRR